MTQNKIKRVVIMPYLLLCVIAILHSLFMLILGSPTPLAWLGALLAIAPMPGFMIYLAKSGKSSTSRYMPVQLACAIAGASLATYQFNPMAALYAWVLGLGGASLYIFWYSKLGRADSSTLKIGAILPAFSLQTATGKTFNSDELSGNPALILFYRGNWCPLCVAQVSEIAGQYQVLADMGVKCLMISTQHQRETQQLAERFDAPIEFLIDDAFELSSALGVLHENGVPAGLGLPESNTSYPTVIITDSNRKIAWLDQTDNYRVRPEPAQYVNIFKRLNTP